MFRFLRERTETDKGGGRGREGGLMVQEAVEMRGTRVAFCGEGRIGREIGRMKTGEYYRSSSFRI